MAKKRKIGIVGGGRFGLTLAEALAANGLDVTLVDRDWNIVQGLADSPIRAIQGDAANPGVLRDAGFADCDIAVVAIGSAMEASTLATINCKDLKVPRVVAKASSAVHGRILARIGARRGERNEVMDEIQAGAFRGIDRDHDVALANG